MHENSIFSLITGGGRIRPMLDPPLTLELRVKRLRRFDLPPADLHHAMIRVCDSAQVVVVAE